MFYWITKHRIYFQTSILVLFAGIFACNNKEQEATVFYNIDSLISMQIQFLSQANAKLAKEAVIGSENDKRLYVPSGKLAWEKELEIFKQLDAINKPVNRDSYLVDDGLMDPASNLTVKAFSCTEDLPVKYLRIFYQESIYHPRKIEALYDDRNTLYTSGRLLSMEFQQIGKKSVLTSYSIQGGQKMVLGDSVTFFITGRIIID